MLTLNVEQAGGTLTYTRQLVRALGRVGELEYRLLLPAGQLVEDNGVPASTTGEHDGGVHRRARGLAHPLGPPPLTTVSNGRRVPVIGHPVWPALR